MMNRDEMLVMAMRRRQTGADAHDVGEFVSIYCNWCDKGTPDGDKKASQYAEAFNAWLSGRIPELRKAIGIYCYGNENRLT